ncbi:hypothetical protein DVH24_009537 [Malus domestica]|uniref:Uncharacterized protein n=1 Tax=Malus domestica TaxID=3750 RepID=A0A498IQV6_MALDO|nr:hypothetical protein DVH24_009537 [Malus domestica]
MRPTKQSRLAEAEESKAAEAQGSKAAEAQQQKVAEAQGPKKFAFDYAIQTPKFRYCRICMKNDHSAPLCPYGRYCSPDVTVGPDAAIVCTCCHGDPKTAHPDVADVEMVTRAVLKSSLPRSRSILQQLDKGKLIEAITTMSPSNSNVCPTIGPGSRQRLSVIAMGCYGPEWRRHLGLPTKA